ncbi:MAG: hypothetical protein KIT34_02825 [Cyanobacteria bacterium TGS_CYA1]|nr:hypothetical protein [Cyanobacteria bacterium TGS_CYA1]
MTSKFIQNLALDATLFIFSTLFGSHPAEAKKPQKKAVSGMSKVALCPALDMMLQLGNEQEPHDTMVQKYSA